MVILATVDVLELQPPPNFKQPPSLNQHALRKTSQGLPGLAPPPNARKQTTPSVAPGLSHDGLAIDWTPTATRALLGLTYLGTFHTQSVGKKQ